MGKLNWEQEQKEQKDVKRNEIRYDNNNKLILITLTKKDQFAFYIFLYK